MRIERVAWLMVDTEYYSGLIAAGHDSSSLPHADEVTSTSLKIQRDLRAGVFVTTDEAPA